MIIFLNISSDLKIFSPTEPLGIFILILGLIFTGMIFFIIYAVSTNKESLEDKKIRSRKESLQKERIGRLFPKKK
jgi:ABC-type Na+ efflux pump permease subunit